ncbi:hypothetical protein [Sulfuricurvum sp.]|uniref:hypothetical protein n=1 Tax=Sulfuricurvum sp. TaxID=2025608 RepID=UPI002E37E62E|nr:hypothetical protein [Sulfuricurvum sp.]HEX5328770.1 hypothetical protein [Sulfuricurvum sp.]
MHQTTYLNNFLNEVGHSVHCMNTIAVALSHLEEDTKVPDKLNISWESNNIEKSSINSRRFAIKSSIVYSIESFYEYLTKVSKDPSWLKSKKAFTDTNGKQLSKAERTVRLLKDIPTLQQEWIILVELLCHWRNRVVHAGSSNASISKASQQYLRSKEKQIYDNYHHFSVSIALENFNHNKFTLKDVTTLITIVIKCARKIDEEFILAIKSKPYTEIIDSIDNKDFDVIKKQNESAKKIRQLEKWLSINYNYLSKDTIKNIVDTLSK